MLRRLLKVLTIIVVLACGLSCGAQEADETAGERESIATATQGTVTVDGLELQWQVAGEGVPCMVIGSPTAYLRIFSDTFRRNFRCVYGDSRIFAPGPAPADAPKEYTFEMAVADADKIRQAAGFDRLVVIGHSVHALMALEYAKAYPEHVSHVVMIAMTPGEGPGWQAAVDQYWDSLASAERRALWEQNQAALTEDSLSKLPPSRVFIAQYLATTPRRWYDPSYDASWVFAGIEMYNTHWTDYMFSEVTPNYDISVGLEGVTVPVFLALGVHDYFIPPRIWDDVRPLFHDLTYRLFERSGHFPMIEEAERFDEELTTWVRSTG